MAFIPREKKMGLTKVEEADLNIEETKSTQKNNFIPELRNWNDQNIKILNILESKGINIYDDNRVPGMYLKGNQNLPNKKIKEFLGEIKNSNQQKQLNNEENNINENIFNFLKNKK